MRLGFLPLSPVIAVVVALGLAAPAEAQDPVPTRLTMSGPADFAGNETVLRIELRRTDDNSPVEGAPVTVERRRSGTCSRSRW